MPETETPPLTPVLDVLDTLDRDDTYYFHDIIILVDNCLFKVPRFYLERESAVFQTMFQLPSIGDSIHGLSEEKPLRLDGIEEEDFRQLLRVLYPTYNTLMNTLCGRSDASSNKLNLGQWTSVLKLSDMWDMERVKTIAVKSMESLVLSPAERIVLGRQYHVDDWVVQGFVKLVERDDPISLDDGERIGFEWAFKIAAMRERCGTRDVSSQLWENRKPRGAVAVPADGADYIRRVLGLTCNK
ncbi:hypothetical protein BD779DRAFT_1621939 [Infundibulicybe gibba]|nr:hypothetical protein BD779DRAFT_1621939 [Infundibulicybe gibba]